METGLTFKTFEIRDSGTLIPVLAFCLRATNETDWHYWHTKAGYPTDGSGIIIMNLHNQKASVDPYSWKDRTMAYAHAFIYRNFNSLNNGDVVDVQYIIGETQTPKISERLTINP